MTAHLSRSICTIDQAKGVCLEDCFLVRDSAPNPYGYKLVTGEGLRANVPYESYFNWIFERARRVPILATEETAAA